MIRPPSPTFSIAQAIDIAQRYYSLTDFIRTLPSERDQNFLFQRGTSQFILKISNINEEHSVLQMQHQIMQLIPSDIQIIPTNDGKDIIRLITYVSE